MHHQNNTTMKKDNPIEEAQRYVDNAKQTLKENGEYDRSLNRYNDDKYVRAAGHYLWNAVLIVLNAVFGVKTKTRPHPDIKDYKEAVGKRDRKLLALVNDGYINMHISMGYDGNPSKVVCDEGIRQANDIIARCAAMLK